MSPQEISLSPPANRADGLSVLVCGASGYIGGRLVPRLLAEGHRVRCLARSPEKLNEYPWRQHPNLTVTAGDLDTPDEVAAACQEIDVIYYLVHSMISAGKDYADQDRRLAATLGDAARRAGVSRIIYLGGLGEVGEGLSEHLRSRREVEQVLEASGVPLTVLRAAMIIGSGSASFEILRYLVHRLPVMVTPRWVQTQTQPIAVRDVLRYLVECLRSPATTGQTLDIGGTDVLTYAEMMRLMARKMGLVPRLVIPVPVLTPRLSSLWIGLVTPVTSRIARPLAEGLRNRTVCRNDLAARLMPGPVFSVEQAVDAALGKSAEGEIETRWSTAGQMPGDPSWSGGTSFADARQRIVKAPAGTVFRVVCRIGGSHGYWGADYLWHVRGWLDKFLGGPGLRRGRRHPEQLGFGEAVDFWRVTSYLPGESLSLRAEMRLPGEAELRFDVIAIDDATSRIDQTARFRPRGLLGIVYWYAVLPLHQLVFPSMIAGLAAEAERDAAKNETVEKQDPAAKSLKTTDP